MCGAVDSCRRTMLGVCSQGGLGAFGMCMLLAPSHLTLPCAPTLHRARDPQHVGRPGSRRVQPRAMDPAEEQQFHELGLPLAFKSSKVGGGWHKEGDRDGETRGVCESGAAGTDDWGRRSMPFLMLFRPWCRPLQRSTGRGQVWRSSVSSGHDDGGAGACPKPGPAWAQGYDASTGLCYYYCTETQVRQAAR